MKSILANKYVLIPLCIILFTVVQVIGTFLLNFIQEAWALFRMFPNIEEPLQIEWAFFTNVQVTDVPWFYGMTAILGLILVGITIYKLTSNFAAIGRDEKGSQRFATKQEVAKQYKKIPEKEKTYNGKGGGVIAHKGHSLYIDDDAVHNLVIGTTRSGKGQLYVDPTIDAYSRAKQKPSMILNDMKGELFVRFKEILEQRGFDVLALNMMNPMQSMSYNPLQLIKDAYKEGNFSVAETLCESLTHMLYYNPHVKDPMWQNSAMSLVNAMILAITEDCIQNGEEEKITLYTVSNMLSELGSKQIPHPLDPEATVNALDQYFQDLPQESVAKMQYATSNFAKGNTRSGIFTTAMAELRRFTLSEQAKMTAKNSLDLKKVGFGQSVEGKGVPFAKITVTFPDGTQETNQTGEGGYWVVHFQGTLHEHDTLTIEHDPNPYSQKAYKKLSQDQKTKVKEQQTCLEATIQTLDQETGQATVEQENHSDVRVTEVVSYDRPIALFMITPDYDDSTHVLPSMFVDQLYFSLAKHASMAKGQECPRQVVFMLDEFGQMPAISGMGSKTTVSLGRNIRFHLIVQSYAQLKEKYGEDDKNTVLGNCGNHIYIKTGDEETAKNFSEKIGNETREVETRSGTPFSFKKAKTDNTEGRKLLDANELMELEKGSTVVFRAMKRETQDGDQLIRPFPIYNKRMPYAYQYLNLDPELSITDIEVDTPHRHLRLSDLIIDFGFDSEDEGMLSAMADKETKATTPTQVAPSNEPDDWKQTAISHILTGSLWTMVMNRVAPCLHAEESTMQTMTVNDFLQTLRMLGDSDEVDQNTYASIRKTIDQYHASLEENAEEIKDDKQQDIHQEAI
ncbi:type IV secretory system conjugative DNA transfer family protein [Salicibibacter cibarius]|uniref:Type IV secretory system conjugative DNA transfer family protein n=1 Tax=Salicibibacter cibarius TaxID=2743000 RepID=A0A7T7CDB9_9BACI|nr:type IV secretory system conjugative DNA transfer family protein [Salicibibacter cibarius]QQK77837.1 type IV secretory system conjugative DNA transfer family protein [Salicibibacter cibarius]